jgi:hypothetical protein
MWKFRWEPEEIIKESVVGGEVRKQSVNVMEDTWSLPAIIVPVRHRSTANTYDSLCRRDCIIKNPKM